MSGKELVEDVKTRTVKARFERDENGYWAVTARLGPNESAISDGQTLPKARRRIVEAVALHLDVPEESIEIEETAHDKILSFEIVQEYLKLFYFIRIIVFAEFYEFTKIITFAWRKRELFSGSR
jgi:predicted RNase H-like HicB family nuclease